MLENPEYQELIYSVPFLTKEHNEFVLWFYTGSKCNLSCTHCYVESSPTANQHPMLSFEKFYTTLHEAVDKNYAKLDLYFTGGEPFLNTELLRMFEECLKYGDTTVLTNGTRITQRIAKELRELQNKSKYKLHFRLSLDGPNSQSNDAIRGKDAFNRAKQGLQNLIEEDFNPILTAMRSWPLLDSERIEKQFIKLLVNEGIPREEQLLKILPPMRIGREMDRSHRYTNDELFTENCFTNYDFKQLQCSKCRMVSERGVWVCPILINEDGAKMGETLSETESSFEMKYMVCWTCRMDGMSCTND